MTPQQQLPPVIPIRLEVLSATMQYLVERPYKEVGGLVGALDREIRAATAPVVDPPAQPAPLRAVPAADAPPELEPAEVTPTP